MAANEVERWRALGIRLRGGRENYGLTRREVAEAAGVSPSTLATLEAGGRNVKGEWTLPASTDRVLVRVARSVGLSPVHIFESLEREPPAWLEEERQEEFAVIHQTREERLEDVRRAARNSAGLRPAAKSGISIPDGLTEAEAAQIQGYIDGIAARRDRRSRP